MGFLRDDYIMFFVLLVRMIILLECNIKKRH